MNHVVDCKKFTLDFYVSTQPPPTSFVKKLLGMIGVKMAGSL